MLYHLPNLGTTAVETLETSSAFHRIMIPYCSYCAAILLFKCSWVARVVKMVNLNNVEGSSGSKMLKELNQSPSETPYAIVETYCGVCASS